MDRGVSDLVDPPVADQNTGSEKSARVCAASNAVNDAKPRSAWPFQNVITRARSPRSAATTAGFSATLRVDMAPRNCRFTRSWTAAKQGAPNVIP